MTVRVVATAVIAVRIAAVVAVAAGIAVAALGACGHSPEPAPAPQRVEPGSAANTGAAQASTEPAGAGPRDATRGGVNGPALPDQSPVDGKISPRSIDERLAAIQKAMNELDKAAQQCWAVAATERFDIEGEVTLLIDIAPGRAQASVVHDTARNAKLSACLIQLMAGYRWAPPLHGQAIQLPFKFRAPDGQNTIDRALVAWNGQGKVSVAVLLDENNSGSDAASMFELAIAAGGTTGLRGTGRAELWYFLGAGQVAWPGGSRAVAAGDMMYVPRGAAREVAATAADLHAMIAMVPGGREGTARAGALPTPEVVGATGRPPPLILPAAGARTSGPATIYADAAAIPDRTLSASILTVAAGARLAEHVHAGEAELLYVLAGSGTLTVAGVDLPVTPTSVVQIPRNTRHAFVATSDVRAVQIYTPAGPEQRAKVHP